MNDGEYLDYLDGRTKVADRPDGEQHDVWSDFIAELKKRVAIAEKKHPVFAEGIPQSVGFISEEVGELNQAVNKNQGLRVLPGEREARQHAGPGIGRDHIFGFGCTMQKTGAD